MAVVCSSLMSCFPGMLLRYCLNDSEMIPFVPFIIITFVVACHVHCISVVRALWLLGVEMSINRHVVVAAAVLAVLKWNIFLGTDYVHSSWCFQDPWSNPFVGIETQICWQLCRTLTSLCGAIQLYSMWINV